MQAPDAATLKQLGLIGELIAALDAASVEAWLFGGWAIDFHAGEITRDHADVELFIWQHHAERARAALVGAGFAAPSGLHPDEGQPFLKDGVEIGAWYLVRDAGGAVHTPGRWADWNWATGAFGGPRLAVTWAGRHVEARVMSMPGLLDMKERFPSHPHGAPLREKDVADIALLRRLLQAR
jgi:hypothetical protein